MKTAFDRLVGAAGLLVLSPAMLLIALAIALEDGFPVLFRQRRVGRLGIPFCICKFRSMQSRPGTAITAGDDDRVTRVGRLLRRLKMDELPQLWNVLCGDMSLVGPRPEVPRFVDLKDPVWQTVLTVRPGMTDFASLIYRNEEHLLAGRADPETYYRDTILPSKLRLNIDYIRSRSFRLDLKLIVLTSRYSFFPMGFDSRRIRMQLLKEKLNGPDTVPSTLNQSERD